MIKKIFVVMVGLLVLPMMVNALPIELLDKGDTTTINGAIFTVPDLAYGGAGTGNIDSFLRIQASGKSASESGYNTDGKDYGTYDMKGGGFTHSLLLEDLLVNIVEVGGQDYYEILLDVNESPGNSLISLLELEIYVLTQRDYDESNPIGGYLASPMPFKTGVSASYSMSPAEGVTIDYSNFAGSGSIIDMIVLIPVGMGANELPKHKNGDPDRYVYLYSVFGQPDSVVDDGFEEWARATEGTITGGDVPPLVPEPGTLILLGSGLAGLAGYGKLRLRRKKK